MAKMIFVVHRRTDLTREECLRAWAGEPHVSIVGKLPGLRKWTQNHVTSAPDEPICDGIGELWFDTDEELETALNSPEMAAAVEDVRGFLDMDKTGLIIVEELSILS